MAEEEERLIFHNRSLVSYKIFPTFSDLTSSSRKTHTAMEKMIVVPDAKAQDYCVQTTIFSCLKNGEFEIKKLLP